MPKRYVFEHVRVISVEERTRTTAVTKDPNDPRQTIEKKESMGWYVRIDDSSAIWFGDEKPEFEAGDRLKITMEKMK